MLFIYFVWFYFKLFYLHRRLFQQSMHQLLKFQSNNPEKIQTNQTREILWTNPEKVQRKFSSDQRKFSLNQRISLDHVNKRMVVTLQIQTGEEIMKILRSFLWTYFLWTNFLWINLKDLRHNENIECPLCCKVLIPGTWKKNSPIFLQTRT